MNHRVGFGNDTGRRPVADGAGQVASRHSPARSLASVSRPTSARRVRSRNGEPTELFVRAVGAELDDGVAGASRSHVFLHGLGGTGRYWTAADGGALLPSGSLLVDLFGFGRSPRPLTRYTLKTHLDALRPVLAEQAPFVLVGHSLGAALAVAYAARHPEDVEALVLIGLPAFGSRRDAIRWLRHGLRGWFLTNMVLTALVCVLTRRLLGPVLPLVIRDVPAEVARDLVKHNFMSSTTSLWNVLYRRDVADDLNAVPDNLPVVFIHGTEDATAPIDPIRRLVDGRPNRQLMELVGVDHHAWLRRPARCVESILNAVGVSPPATSEPPSAVDGAAPEVPSPGSGSVEWLDRESGPVQESSPERVHLKTNHRSLRRRESSWPIR